MISSVALESLSFNASGNSPSFGLALPVTVKASLLPTVFWNLTISAILSKDKSVSSADTVFDTVNASCDL